MQKKQLKERIKHLLAYPWSSLPGYLRKRKKETMIDYPLVLSGYGGDTDKARQGYKKSLFAEIGQGKNIKGEIIGQSIIGSADFITFITERYLAPVKDRERPSHNELRRYCTKEEILKVIEQETGKHIGTLKSEKGVLRQIAMEVLYCYGGLRGPEVGWLFGVDYSSVSQERKRLREKLKGDRRLRLLLGRIGGRCQQ